MDYDLSPSPSAGSRCPCGPSVGYTTTQTTDVPAEQRDETIGRCEYSDGFGRLLQTRTQAEDVLFGDPVLRRRGASRPTRPHPVGDDRRPGRQPGDPDNVVGQRLADLRQQGPGGREVRAVLRHRLRVTPPVDAELGQKATMFYDPRGHVIRTVNPDGCEQRRRHRRARSTSTDPTCSRRPPWEIVHLRRQRQRRAAPTAHEPPDYRDHWNTPASIEVDALGRTVWRRPQRPRRRPTGSSPAPPTTSRATARGHRRRWAGSRSATGSTWPSAGGGWTASTPAAATGPRRARRRRRGPRQQGRAHAQRLRPAAPADPAVGTRRRRRPGHAAERIDYGDGGTRTSRRRPRAARARNLLGRRGRALRRGRAGSRLRRRLQGQPAGDHPPGDRRRADPGHLRPAAADGWQVTPFHVDWQPGVRTDPDARDAASCSTRPVPHDTATTR